MFVNLCLYSAASSTLIVLFLCFSFFRCFIQLNNCTSPLLFRGITFQQCLILVVFSICAKVFVLVNMNNLFSLTGVDNYCHVFN